MPVFEALCLIENRMFDRKLKIQEKCTPQRNVQAKFSELEPFSSAIPLSEPVSSITKRNLDLIIF